MPVPSANQQKQRQVGIGEVAEELFANGRQNRHNASVAEVEGEARGSCTIFRTIEPGDGASVEVVKKLGFAGGDKVDQVLRRLIQGFIGGEGFGGADGGFSDIGIAPAAGDIGAQEGSRVVLHLLLHGVVGGSGCEDRVRSAGVGAGSHGGYIRRFKNEEACRSSPRAGGSDVDDDRHLR